jgi:imidazole glycerol phosphate synthase subunit HisF
MSESVNDVFHKQHAVTEFLDAEKRSDRNTHQCLYNVYGRPAVDSSTVGWWMKRATTSGTGEIKLHNLSRSLLRFTAFHIQSNCDFRFFLKNAIRKPYSIL